MEYENYSKYWETIKGGSYRFCPKCNHEKTKVELKQYPNYLLDCGRCQSVFKLIGNNHIQSLA